MGSGANTGAGKKVYYGEITSRQCIFRPALRDKTVRRKAKLFIDYMNYLLLLARQYMHVSYICLNVLLWEQ